MPVMPDTAILAAGAHDQADETARDQSVSVGASGRGKVDRAAAVAGKDGPAGPLTTGSGGTTAASPQGGTPPNMQAAPDDSSKNSADQKK
jgi:hypothetical protein